MILGDGKFAFAEIDPGIAREKAMDLLDEPVSVLFMNTSGNLSAGMPGEAYQPF